MHPVRGEGMIMLLLLLCQWLIFCVFIRYATVGVILVDALIAGICFHTHIPMNMHAAFFKHPEIMLSPLVYMHTDDGAITGYDQLCLVSMSLLFAGVIFPLFFLGLSTGLSATSTNTTDHFTLSLVRAFLPGKRNAPL